MTGRTLFYPERFRDVALQAARRRRADQRRFMDSVCIVDDECRGLCLPC
jgi:hypothetical protein